MYDVIWSAGAFDKTDVNLSRDWTLKGLDANLLIFTTTEALEAATASLSIEAQKRAAKDAQKKTAKAEAAEQKQADKLAASVVTIKRIERNKKKFVTAVIGLEAFGLDLKKVCYIYTCRSTIGFANVSDRSPKTLVRSSPPAHQSRSCRTVVKRLWFRAM